MTDDRQTGAEGVETNDLVLTARGVSKAFGVTQALNNATLELRRGQVHALLGGNGTGTDRLVTDGPFAGLTLFYPNAHVLSRAFSGGDRIGAFTTSEQQSQIIGNTPSYDALRLAYEGVPHGTVHNGIGGDMAKLSSPNDPLFWVWHAQVDHVWALWQQAHPASARSYGGTNADGTEALVTDTLPPFAETVADVLDPAALCYGYREIGAPAPLVSPDQQPAAVIRTCRADRCSAGRRQANPEGM